MKKSLILLAGVSSLVLPFVAFAQPVSLPLVITSITDVQTNIICKVINWMFGFLIVLAILIVMVTAFQYLFSKGEKLVDVSKRLWGAAIAIILALMAKGFPLIVASFFTGAGGWTGC